MAEGPLFAYVLLREAVSLKAISLASILRDALPDRIVEGPPGDDDSALLTIDGSPIVLMAMPFPLPPDAVEGPLRNNFVWPDAGEAVAAHRAHLIVSVLGGKGEPEQTRKSAQTVTRILGALVEKLSALAAIWVPGSVIASPATLESAVRAVNRGEPALDLWVALLIGPGPSTDDGVRTMGCATTGVRLFAGREIEFPPHALPPATLATRVIGAAHILCTKGPILQDGETLGISPTERIRIHHMDEGARPGIPVLMLLPETLEPDPTPEPPAPRPPDEGPFEDGPPSGQPRGGFGSGPIRRPVFGRRLN